MVHRDLHTQKLIKSPCVSNMPQSPCRFREAVSFNACFSQGFTTCNPPICPRRGSPHHKIVMHVNFTVHGSNEPWQWMLSDFKRLHHMPLPLSVSPAHGCVKNVFSRLVGSQDQSLQIGRKAESHACTLMHSALTNTQPLAHSRSSFSI